ncbi:MAG: hypothetical protein ACI909_001756 [Planctomycetota bacterium]|jgi:hypothetical protein
MKDLPTSVYSRRPEMCCAAQYLQYYLMNKIAEFIDLHCQTTGRDLLKYKQMLECET